MRPEALQAVAATRTGRIGLLATPTTVASGAYEEAVGAVDPHVTLHAVAVPDARRRSSRRASSSTSARWRRVREACAPLREAGVDTVILGCTHYPLIRPMLQRMLGPEVTLISSGAALARQVEHALSTRELGEPARRTRATTASCARATSTAFRELGTRFLQMPLGAVEHVELAERRGGRVSERSYGRGPGELRPTTIEPGFVRTATGSALISVGETRVICTASAQESVPRWMAGKGRGWVTAEYGMLPASTGERKQRDATRGRQDGRTVEIQRLIGRSLRGVIDFKALGERTIYLDCDVLQADGGTRCASITGAYVALSLACARLQAEGQLERSPLTGSVAAVSCGIVDGAALLDLDYSEDSTAEVDANVVMTGDGGLVEVQATAERTPLSRAHLDELLALAGAGIEQLRAAQEQAIGGDGRPRSGAVAEAAARDPQRAQAARVRAPARRLGRGLERRGGARDAAGERDPAARGRRDVRRERARQGARRGAATGRREHRR